jgi:hypothetical protein
MQICGLHFIVERPFILAPFQRNCRGKLWRRRKVNEAELKILNFDLVQAKFKNCL